MSNSTDDAVPADKGQTGLVPMDTTTATVAPNVEAIGSNIQTATGTNADDTAGTDLWARNAMLQGIIDCGIDWAQGDSVAMIEKTDPYGQNIEVDSVSAQDKDHKSK